MALALPGRPRRARSLAHRRVPRPRTPPPTRCRAKLPARSGDPSRFYNDSKSTTPESGSESHRRIEGITRPSATKLHLIAGGYDKGSDLTPLRRSAPQLAELYTIGVTGPSIARGGSVLATRCETRRLPVETAAQAHATRRRSPSFPERTLWDQYVNFEQRGDEFVRLVKQAVSS